MILPEIRESVIRTVSSALATDEDRYEPDYIDAIIHQYRAEAIAIIWQRDKRVDSNWTQQFIAVHNKDLQDDPVFVKFACPPVISLDKKTDGALFVGSIDGHISYRKVTSRAELANNDLHRFIKSGSRTLKALYSDGFWEIHGDPLIKDLRIDGVFADPTDIPTFNTEVDEYPLDDKTLVLMKKLILLSETAPMASSEPDRVSDSTDKILSNARTVG